MNQYNQSIPLKNDEIDLRELIIMLWKGKWLIAFITAVFFALGIAYVCFFQTHKAIFEVEPVSSYEIDKYAELNYLLKQAELAGLTAEQQEKYSNEKHEPTITAQVLVSILMERVRNRQDFLQAAKELNFIQQNDKTEEEWALEINQFVYNIEFLSPLSAEELAKNKLPNAPLNWQIKTEGLRDPLKYKQLLELSLKKSNEFVREGVLHKLEQKINLLKKKQVQDIEDIDFQIKGMREDYKTKISNRIAYLKEQAQIARQLGIAKNTIETQSFNGITGMVTTLQTELPFYLRGYEAIEKELSLLETRTTTDEFIPELVDLNQKRRSILERQLPQRLAQALNASNISTKEAFIAATVDIDEIRFEEKPQSILLFILTVLVGGFVGTVSVFIRNILRGKHTNES